ncbi:MAG: PhzF family phenazine biosynthesis protein [Bacteroidota bacterium]
MKPTLDPLFPIYQVDSFTDAPFRGNPAGVCILMNHRPDNWMQKVAFEMNLSETAFFMQMNGRFRLRWFTPTTEVDLCGHATLATAHVIWQSEVVGPQEDLHFETRSGQLVARREGEWIVLDFPVRPAVAAPVPEGMVSGLGATPISCWRGQDDYLIELASEAEVKLLQPDFRALKAVKARGIIVTAPSENPEFDFVSRFFGPGVGVDEDPVTGSAHCTLAPFWQGRLGKTAMTGYQASERGGVVKVELRDDRVWLKGKAITVLQGVLSSAGTRVE